MEFQAFLAQYLDIAIDYVSQMYKDSGTDEYNKTHGLT